MATNRGNGNIDKTGQNESEGNIVQNPYYGLDDISDTAPSSISINEDKNTVDIVKTVENPYYAGI